jgi:hypothetical protein
MSTSGSQLHVRLDSAHEALTMTAVLTALAINSTVVYMMHAHNQGL